MSYENFVRTNRQSILELEKKFRGYHRQIERYDIDKWIEQFRSEDYNLALKLLNNVNYYNQPRVLAELGMLFSQIQVVKTDVPVDTYFAAFSPAGHSGDTLLPLFRLGSKLGDRSNLRQHRFNTHFVNVSDLVSEDFPEPVDTFVLIDDFIGSGRQALDRWENIESIFYEKNVNEVILAVLIGYERAIERIEERTGLTVITNNRLSDNDRLLCAGNRTFSVDQKTALREYCFCTRDTWPLGYGDCQSNIVFFYRAPNNALSILRCATDNWRGLFSRY